MLVKTLNKYLEKFNLRESLKLCKKVKIDIVTKHARSTVGLNNLAEKSEDGAGDNSELPDDEHDEVS